MPLGMMLFIQLILFKHPLRATCADAKVVGAQSPPTKSHGLVDKAHLRINDHNLLRALLEAEVRHYGRTGKKACLVLPREVREGFWEDMTFSSKEKY